MYMAAIVLHQTCFVATVENGRVWTLFFHSGNYVSRIA